MPKGDLSAAQWRKLLSAPNDWQDAPILGDLRPIPPLHRKKLIEFRETEARNYAPGVKIVRREWRLTDAGRARIAALETEGGEVITERIVAAALKIGKDVVASIPAPARHHTIMHALFDATGDNRLSAVPPDGQGFITSAGRFVGRKEGFLIAEAAGQIVNKTQPEDTLFSEDLW